MVMVSCCRVLSVRSFVPEVRSWSDNDNPVNLYQLNVILCLEKKGRSHKTKLSPSKVPIQAKRWQISIDSSFGVRFPQPAQLSSLKEPGTPPNCLSVSSGCPNEENKFHRLQPTQTATAIGSQRQGWGQVHLCLKAWTTASGGLSEGSEAL